MAKRSSKVDSNGKLQVQLDKLKRGEWVEGHVAREALGLDACPDRDAVVAALHRACHRWENDHADGADERLHLAVHAASVLLREM